MTAPAPSPVAAFLAETGALIRQLDAIAPAGPPRFDDEDVNEIIAAQGRLAGRVQPLRAALEAVLGLADEWKAAATEANARALAAPTAAEYMAMSCRERALTDCTNEVREAVEAALRGAQGGAG